MCATAKNRVKVFGSFLHVPGNTEWSRFLLAHLVCLCTNLLQLLFNRRQHQQGVFDMLKNIKSKFYEKMDTEKYGI